MGKRMTMKELRGMIDYMKDDIIVELHDNEEYDSMEEVEENKIKGLCQFVDLRINYYDDIIKSIGIISQMSLDKANQLLGYRKRITISVKCITESIQTATLKDTQYVKDLLFVIKTTQLMINGLLDKYINYTESEQSKMLDKANSIMESIIKTINELIIN